MISKILHLFVFVMLWVFATYAQMPPSLVKEYLQNITSESYSSHFDSLRTNTGSSRKVVAAPSQSKDHDACRDYIFQSFTKYLGEENVYLHPFQSGDREGLANVIGYKAGNGSNKTLWVIGAHYDSNSGTNYISAPGANDNGSGIAAMLEIARIIGGLETTASVLFAAWDMEEFFTNNLPTGSNRWFQKYISRIDTTEWAKIGSGAKIFIDDVKLNLNFDMIGNPQKMQDGKKVLWLFSGNKKHTEFLIGYHSVFAYFTPEIETVVKGKLTLSDHYTFATRNIFAIEHLESDYTSEPFYHSDMDSFENPDNVDFEFSASVTRGGLAYILSNIGSFLPIKPYPSTRTIHITEHPNAYLLSLNASETAMVYSSFGRRIPIIKQSIEPNQRGLYNIQIVSKMGIIHRKRILLDTKKGSYKPFTMY